MDIKKLFEYKEAGLLSMQKHPTEDLLIWNYSQTVQFERKWDEITLACRGLITDSYGNVKARPFKKFFNLEEHEGNLPDGDPIVTEKMDGSLGITYQKADGSFAIATRGSFTSEQAIHATQLLQSKYANFVETLIPGFTHLFEIIYPSNRVVVDYGELDDLVYLGSVNTLTGEEIFISGFFKEPRLYEVKNWSLDALKAFQNAKDEGFVLLWPKTGFRLKFKFEEYKRLHKLLTGVNERTIWKMMSEGQSLKELMDRVPDEFFEWIEETSNTLGMGYVEILDKGVDLLNSIDLSALPETERKKAFAAHVASVENPVRAVAFALYDERDPKELIWRSLKPKGGRTFKLEV